ncbi:lysine-tRNA ligase [Carex rostrata]
MLTNMAASLESARFFPNYSPLSSNFQQRSLINATGRLNGSNLESNYGTKKRWRRDLVVAASVKSGGAERFYLNFTGFPFPLGPFLNRRTIRTEAVKGCIWLFEQEQALGFSSVSTNIRMTVIKLKSGGLWVHAPIAPTKECIQLLKELDAPVEYIILPTFAYEHKIFVGPFSRKFPRAKVWVAPRQWSWPINLPLAFFGIFGAKPLIDEDDSTPWSDEIEQKVLSSPEVGIGPYVEVAFYHKKSRTLLVTDAVIFVPRQPPECISKESLLESAKNGLAVKLLSKGKEVPDDPVVDNTLNQQKGWERMVLQILFLGPSNLLEPKASFAQMSQKLIVSPIVKTLVFSKVPEKVRDWIDRIASDWKFRRIIPAHFAAPVNASRSDFLTAFSFLDELLGERPAARPSLSILFSSLMGRAASYFPPDDMKTLSSLDEFLVSVGAVKKTVSGRKR